MKSLGAMKSNNEVVVDSPNVCHGLANSSVLVIVKPAAEANGHFIFEPKYWKYHQG